ncbi:MAG TPA: hypothetical protein VNC50_19895 [Planctomycetia bacterium]|nr:hypothetical protein [Planctomycetia bacterium]
MLHTLQVGIVLCLGAPLDAPVKIVVAHETNPQTVSSAACAKCGQPALAVYDPTLGKVCGAQRLWRVDGRPVMADDLYRYEPRVRDARFSPVSSTLPGSGLGAPDTIPVLPLYRNGYFRLFNTR